MKQDAITRAREDIQRIEAGIQTLEALVPEMDNDIYIVRGQLIIKVVDRQDLDSLINTLVKKGWEPSGRSGWEKTISYNFNHPDCRVVYKPQLELSIPIDKLIC